MKLSLALLVATSVHHAVNAAGEGYFDYDSSSQTGPGNWALVELENNQCGGQSQSGIDIPSTTCDVFDEYVFMPGDCTMDDLEFVLHPHAVQANFVGDCEYPKMKIPGEPNEWQAAQFHVHTSTDHAIDGHHFGADWHLVHKEVGGSRYAVLGYFLEPSSTDNIPIFENALDKWEAAATTVLEQCGPQTNATTNVTDEVVTPEGSGRRRKLQTAFNPYELLPSPYSIYTYNGSLTTPPCSEVVFWNVVDTPVKVSVREFVRLSNLILDYVDPETCEPAPIASPSGSTSRPVQPLNGRTITRHCPVGYDEGATTKDASSAFTMGAGALAVTSLAVSVIGLLL